MTFVKTSYGNLTAMIMRLNINGYEDATLLISNYDSGDNQDYATICALRCVWVGNACCLVLTNNGSGSASVFNVTQDDSLSKIEDWMVKQCKKWLIIQCKSFRGYGDDVFVKLAQCPLCGYDAVLESMAVRKGYEADAHCNGCLASLHTITYDTEAEAVNEALTGWNIRKIKQEAL